MRVVRRVLLFAAVLIATGATPAAASPFLPPAGKAFTGLTGSRDATAFTAETGKHPAVFGFFTQFGSAGGYAFAAARRNAARPMLHVSTSAGYGAPERVTPLGIARGDGDGYLVGLNRAIAAYGGITYVRFLSEMNQANNAYCAFDRSGRSRGPSHSTAAFRQAFRRATLILRGGRLSTIDARLHALGLPAVRGVDEDLPTPRVAMLWVPQVSGTPALAANRAGAYWPGGAYVDWVGTDFYSKFPNFPGLRSFAADRRWRAKPFAFGEWAMWDRGDVGWVRSFFAFVRGNPRVRMLLYNQGENPNGPFRLKRFPAARRAIRSALRSSRFAGYAPELRPG